MVTTVAKPRVHVYSDFRLHHTCSIIASEASFLVCSMRGFSLYIYVYIFQAVRRAVNVRNPGHRLQQLRTAREPVFNS